MLGNSKQKKKRFHLFTPASMWRLYSGDRYCTEEISRDKEYSGYVELHCKDRPSREGMLGRSWAWVRDG